MSSKLNDTSMKTSASSQPPGKRMQPEESKNTLDARQLVARFRSKKDLYDYLIFQSKILKIILLMIQGSSIFQLGRKSQRIF